MQGTLCVAYRLVAVLTLWSCSMQSTHCCQENHTLYFIDDLSINCMEINSLDQPNPTVVKIVTNIPEGAAIDIDVRNKIVYWSDTHAWTINKKNLTSGEVKVILKENIGEVNSIAFEWESGLIYWADFLYERIEVANADGSSRKTLVTKDVKSPLGIAVDPASGYMVWADYDYAQRKIMRADLTGENQIVLVNSYSLFGLPLHVVIDHSTSRVYWTDIHYAFAYIVSVKLNGRNFAYEKFLSIRYFPYDLTIFQNNLYWADVNLNGIAWFPFKDSSVKRVQTVDDLSPHSVVGVVVSDLTRQPLETGNQPCSVNKGNCSDLCLLTPGRGRKCACPQGVNLNADGLTCNNESTSATQSPPLPDVRVRLVGSSVHNQGRVEVHYNGQWGTICDDYWGLAEAHVICRMLNFSGATFALRRAFFGPGRRSSPIWLDSVKCRGDESTIAACRHDGWGQNDCRHSEDAGVVCWRESAPANQEPTLAPGPHPELKVRLQGGDTQYEGRVEIYLNNTWGTICDDYWGIEEANVICRMLNFTEGALSTQCCGFYNTYGVAERIWLDDVHCTGDEETIAACRHRGWGRHNCRHTEDVGVVCKHSPVSAPDQIVRLVDGARESEGRVEVFRDGQWGTICDDNWDIKDANVVCRMLNYSRALRSPHHAFFGTGNGKIWLSNLDCVGNETSILQCEHEGGQVDNCDHHEDASVICERDAANLESKSFMLACESGRSLIYHLPLDVGSSEEGVPLALEAHSPQDITFYSKERKAYWTEQSGSIVRAPLNGSSREVIISGLLFPTGIAVDSIGQNLYFADRNGIKVSKLDGSFQTPLIKTTPVHGITLDSKAGYIYFTLTGITPRIMRADMDGRNQVVLANLSSVRGTTLDIELDKDRKGVYFSDETNNLVKYLNLSSLQLYSLLSDRPHRPVGLTLFNGTLYWTGGSSQTFGGAIYKADASNFNGSDVHEIVDLLSFPKGLHAHDSADEDDQGDHPCAKHNGGCSHLCLIKPGGYRCVCPGGITKSCQATPTSTLPKASILVSVTPRESQGSAVLSRTPSVTTAAMTSQVMSSIFPSVEAFSTSAFSTASILVSVTARESQDSAVLSRTPSVATAAMTSQVMSSIFPSVEAFSTSALSTQSSQVSNTATSFMSSSSFYATSSVAVVTSSSHSTVKSSASSLKPTKHFSNSFPSSSIYSIPNYCSMHQPCENGGSCQAEGLGYKCVCTRYFIGRHCSIDIRSGVVALLIKLQENQFNETALIRLIVDGLNLLCEDESERCPIPLSEATSRRRRALKIPIFKPEDVKVMELKQIGENLQVQLATIKVMPSGLPAVISSDQLRNIIMELASNISHILGGKLISVMPKYPLTTTNTDSRITTAVTTTFSNIMPTSAAQAASAISTIATRIVAPGPSGQGRAVASKTANISGIVAGVVVSVLVVVVVIGMAIWYFRVRVTIPYKQDTNEPKTHTTAFENPGYDSAAHFGGVEDGLYEDIPPVVLSPFEDVNEFSGVSNPVYLTMASDNLPSRDGNREGSDRLSSHKTNDNLFDKGAKNTSGGGAVCLPNGNSLDMKVKGESIGDQGPADQEALSRKKLPVLVLEGHEGLNNDSEM